MAGLSGRTYPLSIVVGTVDKATAKFEAINRQISRLTAPVRRLNNRLAALGRAAGTEGLGEKFSKAGEALSGIGDMAKVAVGGLVAVAGAAGLGVHAMVEMTGQFDELTRHAARLGLTVDEFSQLRFAAKANGIEVETFDASMDKFNKTLGEARMGQGALFSLLSKVSPALLKQLRAAKGNGQSFDLLADAMAKLQDPAKQAILATAAFGKSGGPLVDLLKQGSAGVEQFKKQFLNLAGSQEAGARAAAGLDDMLDEMDATMTGVKTTIFTALAPAFKDLLGRAMKFFSENRAQLTQWIDAFAAKLPGAISTAAAALGGIVDTVKRLWDFVGGANGVLNIFETIVAGKVLFALLSVGKAITALGWVGMKAGIVALFNPVGLVLAAVAALAAGAFLVIKNWDQVKLFFVAAGEVIAEAWHAVADAVSGVFSGLLDEVVAEIEHAVALFNRVKNFFDPSGQEGDTHRVEGGPIFARNPANVAAAAALPALPAASIPTGGQSSQAHVTVDFNNMPKGAKATVDPRSTADLDTSTGYQLNPA